MFAIFGDDFRKVRRKSGNGEKCREGGAPGAGHDALGLRHRRIHGAQQAAPNFSGVIDGQVLQQALSDASELNMEVVRLHPLGPRRRAALSTDRFLVVASN